MAEIFETTPNEYVQLANYPPPIHTRSSLSPVNWIQVIIKANKVCEAKLTSRLHTELLTAPRVDSPSGILWFLAGPENKGEAMFS